MKRRLWGIILLSLGTAALCGTATGPAEQRLSSTIISELLMMLGGTLLIKVGQAACDRHEAVLNCALRQLRRQGAISSVEIAAETGATEFDVRESLRAEAVSGFLPSNVAIDIPPKALSMQAGDSTR